MAKCTTVGLALRQAQGPFDWAFASRTPLRMTLLRVRYANTAQDDTA